MTNYAKAKDWISAADVILIGAGAGLSTAAGIDYGRENFRRQFPELVKKYRMTDMYTSSFYDFKSEGERWSYWAKHIDYAYCREKTETYQNLFSLIREKPYFVITTNVDGQFLKSGFDPALVFEIQGTLAKMQCAVGCHNVLYDDLKLVEEIMKDHEKTSIPEDLVPTCPVCGGPMEINLRKDAFFVEDEHWCHQHDAYLEFINQNRERKIVLLDLGTGFNTPGVIRYPFEELTWRLKNARLIRINDRYSEVPFEIKEKSLSLHGDCGEEIIHLLSEAAK